MPTRHKASSAKALKAPAQAPEAASTSSQSPGEGEATKTEQAATSTQAPPRPPRKPRQPRPNRPRPRQKPHRPRKRRPPPDRLRNRALHRNRARHRWSPEDREDGDARGCRARPCSSSWEALGTSAVLLVTDPGALARARAIVERELEEIDRACSRFRADSDLQRVNAGAGRFVPVSRLLIEAVQVALRAAELTDGDVDPTVGNALVLAGYDRDWALLRKPVDAPDRPAREGRASKSAPRVSQTPSASDDTSARNARMAGDRDRQRASRDSHSNRRAPGSGRHRESVGRRSCRGRGARGDRGGQPGQPGRRYRHRRRCSRGWLADLRHRRPSQRSRAAGTDDLDPLRWDRDLQHRGAALESRRTDADITSSTPPRARPSREPGAPRASRRRHASTRTSPAPRR